MGSNPIPSAIYARRSFPLRCFFSEKGFLLVIFGRQINMMRQIRRAAGLTIGAMIYSAGLNLFLVPNNIIDGGGTGMSLLLSELAGIPFSVLIVLLNIPFFILGYKQLGLRLAVSSMFAIIVLSFWSHIFEQMEPVTTDPFLSTIFGGIIIGLGIGLVIKNGGSLDGTEIVAIYLDSRSAFSVGEIILFFNFFILGSAGFVFTWNSAMYSLIAYFICSRMMDAVSTGLDSSKGVFIITTKYDEVASAIVNDMHHSVTRLHGQGGFLKDDKDILYVVISRLEVTKMKGVVKGIDSAAFLSVFDVQEVQGGRVGKGWKREEDKSPCSDYAEVFDSYRI